jgi:hypothetical protein
VLLISVYSLYVGFSQEAYVENAVKRAVSDAIDEKRLQEAVSTAIDGETLEPSRIPSG